MCWNAVRQFRERNPVVHAPRTARAGAGQAVLLPPPPGRLGSARSLLLTVLGEYVLPRVEPAWTSTLLHVLGGLGVEEKSTRQSLARMAADGWIVAERVRAKGPLGADPARPRAR